MTGLAWALFYEKRYSPALDLSQKALAGREKLLGKDHPDYFRSIYLSARLQHVKKEYIRAEPMYRKACGGFERVLGAGHAETKKASIDFEHLLEEMKEMEGLIGM
ncbi:hypothetical protein BGZ57DRAFT_880517 [Hyaloscypha finlandica]|nr:hypothetical protein BGZ57DRAFT_880517 [Hyaloscypha finlandica]